MSCNCTPPCSEDKCLSSLTFKIEDSFLIPYLNGVPLNPVDLVDLVKASETDTRLQLDVINKELIYTGEQATNDVSSADTIPIANIASLISLVELADVDPSLSTDGDILQYDLTLGKWVSYTIPSGTIVTPVGIDENGKVVKSGTPDTPPAPDTVPLGGILIWPASINDLPVSYRRCNGQALSRTVYEDLFELIGTIYGSGDGSTSFNLPNLSTRVVTGQSDSDTQFDQIGETGGSKTHLLTTNEMPAHTHDIRYRSGDTSGSGVISASGQSGSSSGTVTNGASSRGGGQAHNNLQPYMVMNYVMRVV